MVRLMSLRADLPAVVAVNIASSTWVSAPVQY